MGNIRREDITMTGKLYWRDDGLYVYSSTDGQLDIVADTTLNLDGDITIGTGHTFTWSNDGTSASANTSYDTVATTLASGNVIGYIPATVGTVTGYLLFWSGAQLL